MKKMIFALAAGSLLLASCSNDETVLRPEGQAIAFDGFIDKTTRAEDASMENLKQIAVCGFIGNTDLRNFDKVRVSKQTNGSWTYSPIQYWTADKAYYFMAFSSQVLGTGGSHMLYNWPATTETPDPEAPFYGVGTLSFDNKSANGSEDVLYSSVATKTPAVLSAAPAPVAFTFKHALSRVHFTFTNGMGTNGYSIKVNNLRIDNATASGVFTLGTENPAWTSLDGQFELASEMPANSFGNGNHATSENVFVIPCTSTFTISFEVELYLNNQLVDTYTHSVKALPETVLKPGYSYNFAATLSASNIDPDNELYPIVFTVTDVEGWTPETNDIPFLDEE